MQDIKNIQAPFTSPSYPSLRRSNVSKYTTSHTKYFVVFLQNQHLSYFSCTGFGRCGNMPSWKGAELTKPNWKLRFLGRHSSMRNIYPRRLLAPKWHKTEDNSQLTTKLSQTQSRLQIIGCLLSATEILW